MSYCPVPCHYVVQPEYAYSRVPSFGQTPYSNTVRSLSINLSLLAKKSYFANFAYREYE